MRSAVRATGPPELPVGRPIPALTHRRSIDVAAALLVAVPPLICQLAVAGRPDQWSGWVALLGPLTAAAAILLCRRHIRIAVVLLTAAVFYLPAAEAVYLISTSLWVEYLSLTPLIAVGVVTCALGAAMDLVPSLLWLTASTLVSEWALNGQRAAT